MNGTLLMVGPSSEAKGGIATWIRDFKAFDFPAERRYLSTFEGGGALKKFWAALRAYWRFAGSLRGVTVIHVHTSSYASFWRKLPFYVLGRLAGRRIVAHIHGSDFEEFYQGAGVFGQWLISRGLGLTDCVIALSESWASFLRGITTAYVEVLPNGVNVGTFERSSGWPEAAVFLGELSERKGIDDLLQAIALLAERGTPLSLTLGGEGDGERYRRKAGELGISELVHFAGWVDSDQKNELLATHGIFVLPSYREGVPIAILEAMAAGLPVVSCPVGGIPEVIDEGVHGYLIPPGASELLADRLAMLRDPERRRTIGMAARARVASEWDLPVLMTQLESLYDRLEAACQV